MLDPSGADLLSESFLSSGASAEAARRLPVL